MMCVKLKLVKLCRKPHENRCFHDCSSKNINDIKKNCSFKKQLLKITFSMFCILPSYLSVYVFVSARLCVCVCL